MPFPLGFQKIELQSAHADFQRNSRESCTGADVQHRDVLAGEVGSGCERIDEVLYRKIEGGLDGDEVHFIVPEKDLLPV